MQCTDNLVNRPAVAGQRSTGPCNTRSLPRLWSGVLKLRGPELLTPHSSIQPAGRFLACRAVQVAQEAEVGTEEATEELQEIPVEPYVCVRQTELAGGVLEVVKMAEGRVLRVWLPPGYSAAEGCRSPYPVMYLNDGQTLFEPNLSISGTCWNAAETAAELITSGQLPPFVVVGIDHSGATRSFEYTPCVPGTGPGGVRQDAADWLGGGVEQYLDAVVQDIIPLVTSRYFTSTDPDHMMFGGSSFGGICTLCMAMRYPEVFSSILVESPSLWIDEERWLDGTLEGYQGQWPTHTFVAMGTLEYSGNHPDDPQPEFDQLLTTYVDRVVKVVEAQGVDKRVSSQIHEEAAHTESVWAERFPRACLFLCSHWWDSVAEQHSGALYFTVPRRLKAGQPAMLFFNKARSDTLRESDNIQLICGVNNWQSQLQAPLRPACLPNLHGSDWYSASIDVPDTAYELDLAFYAGGELWDNNLGANFYMRVSRHASGPGSMPPNISDDVSVEDMAARTATKLYFTVPEVLTAGQTARLYLNRKRSWVTDNSPNVRMTYNFNNWELDSNEADLKPTNLWRDEWTDWWAVDFQVCEAAFEMNFCFSNCHGDWENNDGHNFTAPVKVAGEKVQKNLREIAHVDRIDHAQGVMDIITLAKRKNSRQAKWTEEKTIRVWLPPGYDQNNPPPGGYPVLYMNDAQNLFEDWLAHQGVSWRLGYTASELILSGQLRPFVIVAIDSAGPMRSLNYLPYQPGTGLGGFRGDAERWPGGGVDAYLHRVVEEIIPAMTQRYHVSTDPAKCAFGGSSFSGVTALYAAINYPHVFGSVLAESPSLWIAEGRFLGDLASHKGTLPERLFMGAGTAEYSATRDHDREDVDALLLHYYCEAARLLQEKGIRGDRLKFLVEEGAGHHELAWQWRLTGALLHIMNTDGWNC